MRAEAEEEYEREPDPRLRRGPSFPRPTTAKQPLSQLLLKQALTANMGATKRTSDGETKHVGPHPSTTRVANPYISQAKIEKLLRPPTTSGQLDVQERSIAEAREDSVRLQGVNWIDLVRRALQLPVRTYTTACVYYHKFRLAHPGSLTGLEYGNAWADACAASLLQACKVEDTLKKSRDILAAAYNLKVSPHDQVGSDDPMFEAPSRNVIGLERMVLEAAGFDFRSKYPHVLMVKISKGLPEGEDDERRRVQNVAWAMMTDLYRTFAPLKQTAATMSMACLELSAHLVATTSPNNTSAIRDALQQHDIAKYPTTRGEVMETLLDLLDLYTQHTNQSILGTKYSLDDFLRIRLALNKECNENNIPRYHIAPWHDREMNGGSTIRVANGHPTPVSPPQPGAQQAEGPTNGAPPAPENGGTLRFMLNPQRVHDEKNEVQRYFTEEWEEYEEEIEVPIPHPASPSRDRTRNPLDGPPLPRTVPRDAPSNRGDRRDRDGVRGRDERDRDRTRGGRFDDRRRFEDRRFEDRDRRDRR